MSKFLILFVDGTCIERSANSKNEVLSDLYDEMCIDEDYHDFISNINMIEWNDGQHHITNLSKGQSITDNNSEYQLSRFLKTNLTKKPVSELREEYEEII